MPVHRGSRDIRHRSQQAESYSRGGKCLDKIQKDCERDGNLIEDIGAVLDACRLVRYVGTFNCSFSNLINLPMRMVLRVVGCRLKK